MRKLKAISSLILKASICITAFYVLVSLEKFTDRTKVTTKDRLVIVAKNSQLKIPFTHFIIGEGVLKPSSGYLQIAPLASGRVKEMSVNIGERIKKGQLLCTLDNPSLNSELCEKKEIC